MASRRIELRTTPCESVVLPLNYKALKKKRQEALKVLSLSLKQAAIAQ